MRRMFAASLAVLSWFALVLQFVVMMTSEANQSIPPAELVVRYFSFFTILTNLIVAITTTAVAFTPDTKLGGFLSSASTQTAVAVYISIVGIVYSLFLRAVWDPIGWQAVADHLLHDAVPLLFVIYWVACVPKSGIEWSAPLRWLVYPLVYVAYSLLRGALASWYPYWFVDVTQLGYARALMNTAFVLAAFVIVGYVFVIAGKLLSRRAAGEAVEAG